MEKADALADRIAIIDQGKIVALGTPDELKENISDTEVMVVKSRDLTPDIIDGLREIYPEVREIDGGIEITARELSLTG